jgi:DNA modification methylase
MEGEWMSEVMVEGRERCDALINDSEEFDEEVPLITKAEIDAMLDASSIEVLPIADIVYKKECHSRSRGIDQAAVIDYSKKLLSLPPIVVNQDNVIVDGVHRYHAFLKAEQEEMQVRRISVPETTVKLANLLIDLRSGIRHSEKDVQKLCVQLWEPNPGYCKRLYTELDVPERTFYEWTKDIRKGRQKEVNAAMASALLDPLKTQAEVAKEFGVGRTTVTDFRNALMSAFADIAKTDIDDLKELDLDFLTDYKEFEPIIYNIWNSAKGDDTNDYYGQFPLRFMQNLLYYHTEPFDFVYDPFAGGGTTIDACESMFRQWLVSDLDPLPNRRNEISEWDATNGLPDWLPKPKLIFLDPPYWKQAAEKYTDRPEDLGNMSLDAFYDAMSNLLAAISKKRVQRTAIVISPTQYPNEGHVFEDHIFRFAEMLTKRYEIEMRYVLPYSTQQYNGTQVQIMKEEKKPLNVVLDLVVWKRIEK